MNLVELDRALRQLRLSGMAAVLETRLRQAQSDKMPPIDLVSALIADELQRRQDRLLDRRHKLARFRDPDLRTRLDALARPKIDTRSLASDRFRAEYSRTTHVH